MRQPTSVIEIAGQPYFLAKDERGKVNWQERWEPKKEGDAVKPLRVPVMSWHKGMGDQRGLILGAVATARFVYVGHPGLIVPSPLITITPTTIGQAITRLVDVGSGSSRRLIALGGRYAQEFNSTLTSTATHDFGAGKSVTDATEYRGTVAVALGDGVRWWYRNTSGTWVENTFGTAPPNEYRYADCFGVTDDGYLVRGRAHYWSKCVSQDYWTGTGAWGAENPIGTPNRKILDVFAFSKWDYVLKEDGLYAFDSSVNAMTNDLQDMQSYPVTSASHFAWYNRLFLCLPSGLLRYVQMSASRTVGLEELRTNLTSIDAYPTAGFGYGGWAYVAYYYPGQDVTEIIMIRQYEDGDASFSPFTAVCAIDRFPGRCNTIIASDISGTPTVYYGRGSSIGSFRLLSNPLPESFQTAETGVVEFMVPDRAPHTQKRYSAIEVFAKVPNGSQVVVSHQWDDGAWTTDGTVTSTGLTTIAITSNDTGYRLKIRLELTNSSQTNPLTVFSVLPTVSELTDRYKVYAAVLRLQDYDQEGGVQTRMTAEQQAQTLSALINGASVQVVTPFRETKTLLCIGGGLTLTTWPKYHEPQPAFELVFREP